MTTKVFQDGADFYAAKTHLWSAPFKVTDHDMRRAELARRLFRAWCAAEAIEPEFEGEAA